MTIRWEPAESEDNVENIFCSTDLFTKKVKKGGRDLWVGAIPQSFVEGSVEAATQRLADLCEKFGATEHVTIRKKGGGKSWALVTFVQGESVTQAVEGGLSTDDGTELRVKVADVQGKIGNGATSGVLFHMAKHHGLKKLKPGTLHLTVDSAEELTMSDMRINDLSTFVNYGEVWKNLKYLLLYLLVAFVFFRVSLRLLSPTLLPFLASTGTRPGLLLWLSAEDNVRRHI